MKRSGIVVALQRLVGRVRFWFFEIFGERAIERTPPAHGDWKETCGWNFRGRFYPGDKTPNSLLKEDESLNMLRELRNYLKERFPHSRDAPGHSHIVDGRWDNDGSECAYCSLWKRINQKLSNAGRQVRRDEEKDNGK